MRKLLFSLLILVILSACGNDVKYLHQATPIAFSEESKEILGTGDSDKVIQHFIDGSIEFLSPESELKVVETDGLLSIVEVVGYDKRGYIETKLIYDEKLSEQEMVTALVDYYEFLDAYVKYLEKD